MKPRLEGKLSVYGAVLLLSALSRAKLVDPLPQVRDQVLNEREHQVLIVVQSWFFDFYSPDDLAQPLLFPVVRTWRILRTPSHF